MSARVLAAVLVITSLGTEACGRRLHGPQIADAHVPSGPIASVEPASAAPLECARAGAPSFRTLESESFEPAVTRSYPEVRYACPTVTARVNLLLTAEARRREDEFRRMYAETTSPTRPYWRQSIQCEMSAIGPRLASVSCIEWQDCGGAHPIWYTFGATVLVEGSDVRVVRLEDLFRPGSRPALVRRARDAVNALKASRGSGPVDDETVDRALGSFALGERSLELLFDDYALGPHIAPIVGVDLSYASLADLLLPDGPVSRL